jgi:hypothetical protein
MLDLLLEYGASMDITLNNKLVCDGVKNDPDIKAVFAKHERWRRVRKALKFKALAKSLDANATKKFKLTADQQRSIIQASNELRELSDLNVNLERTLLQ